MDPNPFTAVDRDLLKRCLGRAPGSWNDFVDRFLSLIYHVIGYTAHLRSTHVSPEDTEDIAAEVLLKIVANDFRVLREFRGASSLATYLTVVSRRICIQELARRQKNRGTTRLEGDEQPDAAPAAQHALESLDAVERLLRALSGKEREIVRLYYLEGRTYEEISTETEVPVNTIGAVLSRARKKLREAADAAAPAPKPVPKGPPRSGASPKSGAVRKVHAPADDATEPDAPALPKTTGSPKSGAVRKTVTPAGGPATPAKPVKPVKPVPEDADE